MGAALRTTYKDKGAGHGGGLQGGLRKVLGADLGESHPLLFGPQGTEKASTTSSSRGIWKSLSSWLFTPSESNGVEGGLKQRSGRSGRGSPSQRSSAPVEGPT